MAKWFGLGLSVAGSLLTIWGAWILYWNSAPDLGAQGAGALPLEFRRMLKGFYEEYAKEEADMERRAKQNPKGFFLVMLGSILQLAGTIVSALP